MRAVILLTALAIVLTACGACGTGSGSKKPSSSRAPSGQEQPVKLSGLCFSPFLEQGAIGPGEVTPEQVATLLDVIKPYTRGVRTFSSTGIGPEMVAAAKARGLYVAAGCDLSTDPAYNEAEVSGLVELARGGGIDLAVVGEEALYFNMMSEEQLIGYIKRVRETGVPVTTSDTWGVLIGHPRVIAECDVVMANMFPYWELQSIGKSMDYLDSCYLKTKKASGAKKVLVETGWPSEGETKGKAVASPANAASFLSRFLEWADSKDVDYYYFEAFDEPWKGTREGAVGAHWGIWNDLMQLKPGMAEVLD
ncbi:MAG: glycosyl hydrolase family 17 protein [Actinomycetota bacterium]